MLPLTWWQHPIKTNHWSHFNVVFFQRRQHFHFPKGDIDWGCGSLQRGWWEAACGAGGGRVSGGGCGRESGVGRGHCHCLLSYCIVLNTLQDRVTWLTRAQPENDVAWNKWGWMHLKTYFNSMTMLHKAERWAGCLNVSDWIHFGKARYKVLGLKLMTWLRKIDWNPYTTLCSGSTSWYSDVSESAQRAL